MAGGLLALVASGHPYIHDNPLFFAQQFSANLNMYPVNQINDNIFLGPILNKIINLEKNDECPISNISFIPNCTYCICSTCKYNIDADTLKECFKFNDKKCPMCRSEWTDFNIYKNNLFIIYL
jgi:hypothetical protein